MSHPVPTLERITMPQLPALLAFSHLRWDFVYQRPQHLLSRLAARRRVVFVEEPIHHEAAEPSWERREAAPGVLVCRPRTNLRSPGFSDEQLPSLEGLLRQLLQEEALTDYVAWFYTPMAWPLTRLLQPR